MAITFQSQITDFKLNGKHLLKKWIAGVIGKHHKLCGEIGYDFVSDKDILAANKQFLKHHTYTDIITFDYSDGKKISGDIFISVDRVRDNALKLNQPFEEELLRVMIHGVLHLLGYEDKTKNQKLVMRKKENACLREFKKIKRK